MRGLKFLLWTLILLPSLALVHEVAGQVAVVVGGPPPACPYGYYSYPPYACAPYGFYGPGYFYNGIFLGIGPWRNWGYTHGWGYQRYHPGGYGPGHGYPPPPQAIVLHPFLMAVEDIPQTAAAVILRTAVEVDLQAVVAAVDRQVAAAAGLQGGELHESWAAILIVLIFLSLYT